MDVAQERVEIQRMLVEIDRKMAEEVGQRRVPRMRSGNQSFPIALWILTALCFAWWMFGKMVMPNIDPIFFRAGFYIGLLGVLISGWKTIAWVWWKISSKLRPKAAVSEDDNDRLRELRAERNKLMQRLEDLKKMER